MRIFVRLVTVSVLVLALITPLTAGQKMTAKERDKAIKALKKREMIPTNKYGYPVRDAEGNPVSYSKEELEGQHLTAPQPNNSFIPPPAVSSPNYAAGSLATWSYGAFGNNIGRSNIVASTVSGRREIYIGGTQNSTFGSNDMWQSLVYNSGTGEYEGNFVSTYFSGVFVIAIHVADILSTSPGNEIAVVLSNGTVHLYSQDSKAWLEEHTRNISNVLDVEVADVDNDGKLEFVMVTSGHLYVYANDGGHQRDTASVSGSDIVIAEMDGDGHLEIACSSGIVYDYVSDTIQWNLGSNFGYYLRAADIDGDTRAELVCSSDRNKNITAYNVEAQTASWTFDLEAAGYDTGIDTLLLSDVDDDTTIEILVGFDQWGDLMCFDSTTRAHEWTILNPNNGITKIAVADTDGDTQKEVIFGAGYSDTGPDHLYIANWQTQAHEWISPSLTPPFIGPVVGDLDGDGNDELVAVSFESASAYDSGIILVFNTSHELIGMSAPIVDNLSLYGAHDIQLYDVDGDDKMEIMVAADRLYEGIIEIFDWDSATGFTRIWNNATRPEDSPFWSVRAADVDSDGDLEIICGSGYYGTDSPGSSIYIYDYATGAEEWHSGSFGSSSWQTLSFLVVANLDSDSDIEIAANYPGGDIRVFNGRTHTQKDTIVGPFTSMQLVEGSFLAAGNDSGIIRIYAHSGGGYYVASTRDFTGVGKIDGISADSTLSELHFGAKSYLNVRDNTGKLWRSEPYGFSSSDGKGTFGKRTVTFGGNTGIYTAGFYSINAFDYTLAEAGILTVSRPNGGEQWVRNTSHDITWSASADVGNLNIFYSTDNGSNWTTIVSNTPNDGSYTWTVPDTPSYQCLVRIDEVGTLLSDTSDRTFAIVTQYVPPSITVTTPNGGERWEAGSWHTIHWTWTGSLDNVNVYYSLNNGASWTTLATNKYNTGATAWKVPSVTTDQALIQVKDASSSTKDQSNAVFSIVTSAPPTISLSHSEMTFSAIANGAQHTGDQYFSISNTGGSTLKWMVSDDATWLNCNPSTGQQYGRVSVQIDNTGLKPGDYTGTITVSDPAATNGAGSEKIKVYLKVMNETAASPPMGQFATPLEGAAVSSSIPVTGWAIDDIEVVSVKIYNGKSYVGDATFVEGARPDIQALYPDYPFNSRAGWGYMLLTNFLPNGGNGTYTLNAYATDSEGNEVHLGSRTIYCNNNDAVKPFGAIDTPEQGGNATGQDFINWGWALTPMPHSIPIDGSTIYVWIDGVKLGNPTEYNLYRSDIYTLFRDYANSQGAVGYYKFDTTTYNNGIHTIQWTVTDTAGNTDGVGSRYFNIHNIGGDGLFAANSKPGQYASDTSDMTPLLKSIDLEQLPIDFTAPAKVKTAYRPDFPSWTVFPGNDGILDVQMIETGLLEVAFAPGTYLVSPLPVGATMVPQTGKFHWQPGAGFLGLYTLDFIKQDPDGQFTRYKLNITINPRN